MARDSYGRLLSLLVFRSRDIAAAEDALGDALYAALRTWPVKGVPDSPDAWLLTAARRNLGHARSRSATVQAAGATLALLEEERAEHGISEFGDERLKLMFVCAHPAIDDGVQAPLMLQTVLGLNVARISASFLVSPAAMNQKLVRAKARVRDAGIGFSVPDIDQAAERVDAVLGAIYAAYGTGWEDVCGADLKTRGLSQEAIWLGRLAVELVPGNAEALGLLSLMLHCEARRSARRGAAQEFVPLDGQDPDLWQADMIGEAERLLLEAARQQRPGRFQIEAAIQSLHVQSAITGQPNPLALMQLYDLLVALAPCAGAQVARACAYAQAGRPDQAIDQLEKIADPCRDYQPWWVARARSLHLLGRAGEAAVAARTAAGLSSDPAVRGYLLSGALLA